MKNPCFYATMSIYWLARFSQKVNNELQISDLVRLLVEVTTLLTGCASLLVEGSHRLQATAGGGGRGSSAGNAQK